MWKTTTSDQIADPEDDSNYSRGRGIKKNQWSNAVLSKILMLKDFPQIYAPKSYKKPAVSCLNLENVYELSVLQR